MKILHPATTAAAARRGWKIQVNQHAPDGYSGAYSVDAWNHRGESASRDLGSRVIYARAALRRFVRELPADENEADGEALNG